MPTEIKLWRIEEDRPKPVSQDRLDLESRLEDWIRDDIGLVNDGLLVIGQQVRGIDLLAIDSKGNLVILELKRDRTPRTVVAQTLDYASWVQTLDISDIQEIVSDSTFLDGKSLEEMFREKFGYELPAPVNQAHRMYIVASSLDSATERIIEYLSETHGVDINAATFAYFNSNGQEMIGRSMLLDEEEVQIRSETRRTSNRRPNRTIEELRGIAEENGVGELCDRAINEFVSIFGRSPITSQTTMAFNIGNNTAVSIVPGWSSGEIGLVLRIRHNRILEYFSLSEDEFSRVCGAEMRDATDLDYGYWGGEHLFDADRLDRLIGLLKQNAPQA